MNFSLLLLLVLPVLLTTGQSPPDQQAMLKMLGTLCAPSLGPQLAAKVVICEAIIGSEYRQMFAKCALETLGVPELALPLLCYQAFPGREQLTDCVNKQELVMAAKTPDIPVEVRDQFKAQYQECMQKAL